MLRRVVAVSAAVLASGTGLVVFAAPQASAHICTTYPLDSSGAPIFASAATSSARVGTLTRGSTGCTSVPGEAYSLCGGGSTYIRVSQSGVSGFAPSACVEVIYF